MARTATDPDTAQAIAIQPIIAPQAEGMQWNAAAALAGLARDRTFCDAGIGIGIAGDQGERADPGAGLGLEPA